MPEPVDVAELLDVLRRIGGEPETVEVKSGAGGFPGSLKETLVAFANTDGGTVLVGVDEDAGFQVVDLPDVARYRDNLVALARDTITPPLTVSTDIVEVEGRLVLLGQVPDLPADQRPAYVTSKGMTTGAYLRTGDGDRRMSEGEIGLLYASRTQPTYDQEPVPGTSTEDLDQDLVRRTLERVRAGSPRLRRSNDTVVLHNIGVLAERRPDSPLTLAGLLTFGDYPQRLFPQLMVSVVVHPPERGETRFLDNVTVRGPIPDLVSESLAVLRRNLAARAVMTGTGRRDQLEFPLGSVREAIVNAVLHRDYSPLTRGTQVQVDLFPDRLVVRSPGGLYGGLTTDDLGQNRASSSRNAVLASLLSDTYLPHSDELIAENRHTGVPTMIDLARDNGLPRPVFDSSILSFTVTMDRSQLLGPDVRRWIAAVAGRLPSPRHEVALAMLRTGPVTNSVLREWGANRVEAGQVLRDLVTAGLAVKEGGRRYARYRLTAPTDLTLAPQPPSLPTDTSDTEDRVASALRSLGEATTQQLLDATGFSRPTVNTHVNALVARGQVVPEGARTSPKRRYRWVGDTGGDRR
ncbi:ATP-binding protein [Kineococcus sp. TBRC 1896]|uniref:ATP-binding protein n=1 Tax=Kineococcus mangrovi TaxID=1660183 RepID=A0ABV4HZC2_9ACTN